MSPGVNTPFTIEKTVRFLEELSGMRFIDADTQRPVLELVREREMRSKKSDYESWLDEQDESTQLEHRMGAI